MNASFLEARLEEISGAPFDVLALAVSGGGDSTALLILAAELAKERAQRGAPLKLFAFTVDHGLRPGSRAEAEGVGRLSAALGVDHEILTWEHADSPPDGNVQAAAREARYRLMSQRRRERGVGPLLTAHTLDDVAETFLIRLARGSGVDGLAAMAARRLEDGVAAPPLEIWRPLLSVEGAALRALCRSRGVEWVEDPSNVDSRYARTQAREALAALSSLGLSRERLVKTAEHMARARDALSSASGALLQSAGAFQAPYGALKLRTNAFATAPREVGLRAFAEALRWVGGNVRYAPRFDSLIAAFDDWIEGRIGAGRTLHGCVLCAEDADSLWVGREPSAAERLPLEPGTTGMIWDGRFAVSVNEDGEASLGRAAFLAPIGGGARPEGVRFPSAPLKIRESAPALWRQNVAVALPSLENGACGVSVVALRPPFC